jgi:hypothetical protein
MLKLQFAPDRKLQKALKKREKSMKKIEKSFRELDKITKKFLTRV